ncbi:MAG: iron-sulfur cluster-binding protein [Cytophagales bacterium]|nr:iron-sulfur cluster-binding protein [Cytophagales bacterium]
MQRSTKLNSFLKAAETKAFDQDHRKKINFNIGKYNDAVEVGVHQFSDYELARQRAAWIKAQTINNLDRYLIEFEKKFTKNGGKLIWVQDKQEATKEILAIFEKKSAGLAVKSKSMTTEEIDLNESLEANGIETVETDLGEYIVQLAGQKPYHIVTPAMHFSKKDVSDLFHKKLNIPPTDDARVLTLAARKLLREKYINADIGITGGNFLIADIGGVAITENEGNARLSTTFPKTHIAVVGIEKMIPSISDLALFWPLLAASGTGQWLTVYNTIFTGARQNDEHDGPEEMYVILLDNGRTKLLAKSDKRQALSCIRCGACLNVCPVYKNIGGHTYATTYSGPIGSVITPHFEGFEKFKHLSYASSLCGACSTVCPVKIDIHNLLLLNRKESVKEGSSSKYEKFGYFFWKKGVKNRKLMNFAGTGIKDRIFGALFKKNWGKRRSMPVFPKKSFNQLWKSKH